MMSEDRLTSATVRVIFSIHWFSSFPRLRRGGVSRFVQKDYRMLYNLYKKEKVIDPSSPAIPKA
jgi:hypothetical protein